MHGNGKSVQQPSMKIDSIVIARLIYTDASTILLVSFVENRVDTRTDKKMAFLVSFFL